MDVFVTRSAAEILEVVERLGVGRRRLVAIVAGHGNVAASQREAALLVPCDGEIRHLPGIAVVALFASVLPWIAADLSLVLVVVVAIGASGEFDFVLRVFACGYVARGAFDVGVRRNQRVLGFGVVRSRECRGAPSLYGVTALAFAFVRPLCELSLVFVLVAIGAGGEGNLCFEVAALVAVNAGYLTVFSNQRVGGLGVVER